MRANSHVHAARAILIKSRVGLVSPALPGLGAARAGAADGPQSGVRTLGVIATPNAKHKHHFNITIQIHTEDCEVGVKMFDIET